MEPFYRVHAGEEPLRQPIHAAGGSPEYCIRPRRAGEVASFSDGQHDWVVCGRHNAAACTVGIAAEEVTVRQHRASQDSAAPPCLISAYAPRLDTTAAPGPRDHDEAWPRSHAHLAAVEKREGAILRQRRESQDEAAPPFYRSGCLIPAYAPRLATTAAPASRDHDEAWQRGRAHLAVEEATQRQRRAAALSRPTTPASPRRPRRRRGTTKRRGCVAARTSPPTGRVSLDEAEAEADASTSSGEAIRSSDGAGDRACQRLTTHVDTSVVVLIDTPADGGTLVRGGVGGAAKGKKAASDVFLADASRDDFLSRFTLAIALGPVYWIQELIDWVYMLKGSPRDRIRDEWSWLGVVGRPIVQEDDTCAICGTLVCLEARHRLDFERRHGFRTFPYSIPDETVNNLKKLCSDLGVWIARVGAHEEGVLKVIQRAGGSAVAGVPGWKPCSLQVKSWKYHQNSLRQPMSQSSIARLIRAEGPLLGAFIVTGDYYADGWDKEDQVYQRVPNAKGYKSGTLHLVVCAGYRFQLQPIAQRRRRRHGQTKTELHVEVVDNHGGPVRWILATSFTGFVEIHVEPLDATELRVSLWRRFLDTLSHGHRS